MYPALAVLQRLLKSKVDVALDQVLWVGSSAGMEVDLVKREGVPYSDIPAAGVHGVGLQALPGNLLQLLRGYLSARQVLHRFKPDAIFFTGGYIAVPVALAARLTMLGKNRPRILVFLPDIEPGLALKLLIWLADHVAVSVEASRRYLSRRKQVSVTGYPVRADLGAWDAAEARRFFGLSDDLPVLCVTGGSRGARSINRAVTRLLPELLQETQVVHVSGHLDWAEIEQAQWALPPELASRYHPYPYLHDEMGALLAVADVVLSRAGASSLGEYPLFGLPVILVPYPYAWRYQMTNARYLAEKGEAIVIQDGELPNKLLSTFKELIGDRQHLTQMRQSMSKLAQPQAAEAIARLLYNLGKGILAEGNQAWSV